MADPTGQVGTQYVITFADKRGERAYHTAYTSEEGKAMAKRCKERYPLSNPRAEVASDFMRRRAR